MYLDQDKSFVCNRAGCGFLFKVEYPISGFLFEAVWFNEDETD